MSDEASVPSAPEAVDIEHRGGRIFERVRRENIGDAELEHMRRHSNPMFHRMAEAIAARQRVEAEVDPAVSRAVERFLAQPPSTEPAEAALATIVRDCFPRTHARHRRVYESLGRDLDRDGLAREADILAGRVATPRPEESLWSRVRALFDRSKR